MRPDPELDETLKRLKKKRTTPWVWLLALPYLGLCFPQMYLRTSPELWGFPFFYWYQFVWVVIAAAVMAVVYCKLGR